MIAEQQPKPQTNSHNSNNSRQQQPEGARRFFETRGISLHIAAQRLTLQSERDTLKFLNNVNQKPPLMFAKPRSLVDETAVGTSK
jgi:hypothetical protein